jgi:quinol monooxygenase YgiN
MAFILVRYKIQDFKRWKTTFSDAFDMRKQSGEKNYHVFKNPESQNEMVILQEWESLASARRFSRSKKLRRCMEKAGVVGKPEVVFLKEIPLSI